jgi:hypothetical protein
MGCYLSGIDFYHPAMSTGNKDINFVFVLGMMPRSGTNYLRNLLCLHPECVASAISEDALVENSNMLMKYVAQNYFQWETEGKLPEIQADELLVEGIGQGLLAFLKQARCRAIERELLPQPVSCPKYMVTKTPSVRNIRNFFRLFPNERLLILVRDGRSLVESINLSFGYRREDSIRNWANAARNIFNNQKKWEAEGKQFLIVKYEDLYQHTEREMKSIFFFLGLEADKYDFDKALKAPVVGSSVFKREGEVHWRPVEKTPDFDPIARSAGWTRWQHERFNWLAADELRLFGYEPAEFKQRNPMMILRNYAWDFFYTVRRRGRKFRKFVSRMLNRAKPHLKESGTNDT